MKALTITEIASSNGIATTIDDVSADLLQNIIGRLPAVSFASAACVNRSWNLVSDRVLSRPKLSSAFYVDRSLHVTVERVVNKVLAEPIRPQFAIVSVGPLIDPQEAHQLITTKLGSRIPIITYSQEGCVGKEADTDEFMEWGPTNYIIDEDDFDDIGEREVMLIVGYLPGIKVKTIPLLTQVEAPEDVMIDKFVTDIREFSNSISGRESPAAVMMFSHFTRDIATVMEKMDYALSPETVIVGACSSFVQHTSGSSSIITVSEEHVSAVALVFAVDMNRPSGIGETHFHAVISSGLAPVGPAYKVRSVKEEEPLTFLSARRERSNENLGAGTIMNQAYMEPPIDVTFPIYIGVTKKRNCSIGQEKVRRMTSLAFHHVLRSDPGGLTVNGIGIKRGDTFRLYYPDHITALSCVDNVSNHMRSSKQQSTTGGDDKRGVFGGLMFTCAARGELFFDEPNVDSPSFLDNFPGVTFGGTFCGNGIGRGNSSTYVEESQEQKSVQCYLHHYGAVYLIMSYTP